MLQHFMLYAALLLAPAAMAQAVDQPVRPEHLRATAEAHRKAEHERIRSEREAIKARQVKAEAACYQRFAVEDCLREVRAEVRDALARLRSQEIELNDAERKEKAADRLKAIEEKQRPLPAPPAATNASETLPRKPSAASAQRGQEAASRAEKQGGRANRQGDEQAVRSAQSAERAAKARLHREQALQAAQERRVRVEKAAASAAAQGRRPAAGLPPASAAMGAAGSN